MRYLITILLVAIFGPIISISAQEFSYDGFLFSVLDENTCEFKITPQMVDTVIVPSKAVYQNKEYEVASIAKDQETINRIINIKSIEIPNTVTKIADYAFYGCQDLTDIKLPNSIQAIGKLAFYYCMSLKSITLSNSLKIIDDNAFKNCYGLKEMIIPQSVEKLGKGVFYSCLRLEKIEVQCKIKTLPTEIFYGCGSLTDVKLPNSLERIDTAAFAYCETLQDISLPNSIEFLGHKVFDCCWKLQYLRLPNSLKEIYDDTFEEIAYLREFSIESANQYFCTIDGILYSKNGETLIKCPCAKEEALNLSPHLKWFNKTAFLESSIKSIKLPTSVTSIPDNLFSRSDLESVVLSENLDSIGSGSFFNCGLLLEILLPPSLSYIGRGAFDESALHKINIPASVRQIETPVFKSFNLKEINVDESNEKYKSVDGVLYSKDLSILYECPRCKESIELPNSLVRIDGLAFRDCDYLTAAWLPSSSDFIMGSAFSGCKNLTLMYSPSPTPLKCYSENISILPPVTLTRATLYVPVGSLELYKATAPWSYFGNIVEMQFSGIGEVENDVDMKIYIMDGSIIIENNDKLVEVIGINGATVYRGFSNRIDNLVRGIYIVRIGNQIKKVRV